MGKDLSRKSPWAGILAVNDVGGERKVSHVPCGYS